MQARTAFFGPTVVRATFVMAMFGWGAGLYGPPVFLHAVVLRTGWSLALVSAAVTVHHLSGALAVPWLPALHRRFGVGPTATAGAACVALGVGGWSVADAPWQLFACALASGAGWVTMGAVAVHAAIAPWYVRSRPMALAKAYNGASVGGVVFSPLWVWLIARCGFTAAAAIVGSTMIATVAVLAYTVYAQSPERLGQCPDGDAREVAVAGAVVPSARVLAGRRLWCDRQFATLALGMAAGLFAQIGLLAHLFSLLVPVLGAQAAGLAMSLATACAIGGRLVVARAMPFGADRRIVAALAYVVQAVGSLTLLGVIEHRTVPIVLGIALVGSGIGNATSLPPLIAQAEFLREDVPRVVALIVALAQATYAFAPAAFGLLLSPPASAATPIAAGTTRFLVSVAAVQALAMLCFLAGRKRN